MGKLVNNGGKKKSEITKKDKIIFGILLVLGLVPLLLMIVAIVFFLL